MFSFIESFVSNKHSVIAMTGLIHGEMLSHILWKVLYAIFKNIRNFATVLIGKFSSRRLIKLLVERRWLSKVKYKCINITKMTKKCTPKYDIIKGPKLGTYIRSS